jgi:hypothetical protein
MLTMCILRSSFFFIRTRGKLEIRIQADPELRLTLSYNDALCP